MKYIYIYSFHKPLPHFYTSLRIFKMFLKNEIITKREIHTNNLFLKDLIKKTKFEEEK